MIKGVEGKSYVEMLKERSPFSLEKRRGRGKKHFIFGRFQIF